MHTDMHTTINVHSPFMFLLVGELVSGSVTVVFGDRCSTVFSLLSASAGVSTVSGMRPCTRGRGTVLCILTGGVADGLLGAVAGGRGRVAAGRRAGFIDGGLAEVVFGIFGVHRAGVRIEVGVGGLTAAVGVEVDLAVGLELRRTLTVFVLAFCTLTSGGGGVWGAGRGGRGGGMLIVRLIFADPFWPGGCR